MATPEPYYVAESSVVATKPRVREEVREELREEIRMLDMPRLPPPDKLRVEREAVMGSSGEVEIFEKSWRKTARETISEIQRKVDTLGAPEVPQASPVGRPSSPSLLPARARSPTELTPAPAPLPRSVPRPLGGRLTPAEQRAIGKHLGATLDSYRVEFNTTRGRVVEVQYKKGGQVRTTTVVLAEGNQVRTLDDIARQLDALPLPSEVRAGPHTALPMPAGAGEPDDAATSGPTVNRDVETGIEGIGPVFGKKLRDVGILTLQDLADADASGLAGRTGIKPDLLAQWQAMARLQAVRGVGPQYSELLVRAGITDLDDLAAQEPGALAERLNAFESERGVRIQGSTIRAEQAATWVAQARALGGMPVPAAPAPARAAPPPALAPAAPPRAAATLPGLERDIESGIEGVGPVFGRKLRDAGIVNLQQLLDADRAALAAATGIRADQLERWQAMAHLQAIRGVGPQYSELLVRAGVPSMAALAGEEAQALADKLNAFEASLGVRVQGSTIRPDQTAGWIEQARALLAAQAPAPAGGAAEAPKKKGFGLAFGKKKEAPAEAAAPADAGEEPGKKKFGLSFGRKK